MTSPRCFSTQARRLFRETLLGLLFVGWLVCRTQAAPMFSQLVVFGDSLSDTGDFALATQSAYGFRYPGHSFNYADGRFTNDASTSPAAQRHQGVWHEQLASLFLGLTPAQPSLGGGTDYAYGSARTTDGRRAVAVAPGASIQIDDMGQQVTNYLGNHAPDPRTLYVVWGGANDLFADASAASVTAAAQRETALVRRLAEAGARSILVPNLPPLGATPAYSGNAAQSAALNSAAASFRSQLNDDLDALAATLSGEGIAVALYRLDLFDLFNRLSTSGGQAYGFTNVTASAQGNNVVADQYLFWDGIHPTAAGHFQIAAEASLLLATVPPLPQLTLEAASGGGSQAHVGLNGISGRTYRVQSSDDLNAWTTRATLVADATTGRVEFTDPPPLPVRRFYRTLQP